MVFLFLQSLDGPSMLLSSPPQQTRKTGESPNPPPGCADLFSLPKRPRNHHPVQPFSKPDAGARLHPFEHPFLRASRHSHILRPRLVVPSRNHRLFPRPCAAVAAILTSILWKLRANLRVSLTADSGICKRLLDYRLPSTHDSRNSIARLSRHLVPQVLPRQMALHRRLRWVGFKTLSGLVKLKLLSNQTTLSIRQLSQSPSPAADLTQHR